MQQHFLASYSELRLGTSVPAVSGPPVAHYSFDYAQQVYYTYVHSSSELIIIHLLYIHRSIIPMIPYSLGPFTFLLQESVPYLEYTVRHYLLKSIFLLMRLWCQKKEQIQ